MRLAILMKTRRERELHGLWILEGVATQRVELGAWLWAMCREGTEGVCYDTVCFAVKTCFFVCPCCVLLKVMSSLFRACLLNEAFPSGTPLMERWCQLYIVA